jgi:ABC-2 type transport system ATP-binding protein
MEKIIKIQSIFKKYSMGSPFAVQDLSLNIRKGEFFGLLGPNGSGKTTTLSIISGLLKPSSGNIFIKNNQPAKMKKIIGFAPQDIALYETLTLKENLNIFGRLYKLSRAVLKNRIIEVISITQLSDVKNKIVTTFSGGMKRRANLAVALLHNPEILILDEPTVGIDPQSRNLIFESLEDLNKHGITIVYSTHYMEEVERLCSKIAIIDYGQIVEKGTIKKLLKRHNEVNSLGELFLKFTGNKVRNV